MALLLASPMHKLLQCHEGGTKLVVTLLTFNSNLSNFERNPIKSKKKIHKLQKNSKNPQIKKSLQKKNKKKYKKNPKKYQKQTQKSIISPKNQKNVKNGQKILNS